MLSNTQRGRKIAGVAAALCLAASLCTCQGGTHEEAQEQNAPAAEEGSVTQADLDRFDELMLSQDETYSIDELDEFVLGEGDNAESGVNSYFMEVDDSGETVRAHAIYGEDDTEVPGIEMYVSGDTIIRVQDDVALDVSVYNEESSPEGEPILSIGNSWETASYALEDLVGVEEENGKTTFSFDFKNGLVDGVGLVEKVQHATVTYTFDAKGTLLESYVEAEGEGTWRGETVPAQTKNRTTYHDWGRVSVPEAPEAEGRVVSDDRDSVTSDLAERLGSTPSNVTCQVQTTTGLSDSDGAAQSEMYLETLIDGDRAVVYLEVDGNEEDAMLTFIGDGQAVAVQHGEIISTEEMDTSGDLAGSQKALAMVDCAYSASFYEYDNGSEMYVLEIDGDQAMEVADIDGLSEITDLVAVYVFDPAGDGNLTGYFLTVEGVDAGSGQAITMEIDTFYSEFGTTEVPEMPAV
ncbi:hypothetical protein [uncultured Adlercreutzia sp.]|uniref:hypothetical protein n=1 Tax=uncultured Adlercreutzia sp. TaxID=875803 RepID=UPI0026F3DB47|nr:hypothetical protein [uncultured Adlercreutzia sp.]